MPDWRRIIVGDALKVYSHDLNYYRDIALLCPFLIFAIASTIQGFSGSHTTDEMLLFHRELVAAVICLLLAKERLFLIGGTVAFVVVRGLIASILHKEWKFALGFLIAAAVSIAAASFIDRATWRTSYRIPDKHCGLELLIGITSLLLTLFLEIQMSVWPPIAYFPKAFIL